MRSRKEVKSGGPVPNVKGEVQAEGWAEGPGATGWGWGGSLDAGPWVVVAVSEWVSEGNEETGALEEEAAPPDLGQTPTTGLKQPWVPLAVKAPSEAARRPLWEGTVPSGALHRIASQPPPRS